MMNSTQSEAGICHGDAPILPELVDVPGGEFWMGCETGRADESPVHLVWVDAFAMGATTITNEQYRAFTVATGGAMPPAFNDPCFCHPRQPVVAITWLDATAYCNWLSAETGSFFRLPTEAEWEWAIRDGRDRALYAWGDDPPETLELYRTGWQENRPHCVALHSPSRLGLFDLGDNVHEWCLDWYNPQYYAKSSWRNPVNLEASSRRASRGGAWRHRLKVSRCAARSSLSPGFAYTDYGFRIVRIPGVRRGAELGLE